MDRYISFDSFQVSEELGLPGNPVFAYENAKDKFGTRRALAKAGLATPAAVQVRHRFFLPISLYRNLISIRIHFKLNSIIGYYRVGVRCQEHS